MKLSVSAGNHIEDNGNRFTTHATTVDLFKKVRESLVEIMRIRIISSASHNVISYRFVSKDKIQNEGSDDNGEYGAGRALLRTMCDNGTQNALVVVSRWFGSKIGARRFTHIKDTGASALTNYL